MDKAKQRGVEANPHDEELREKPDAIVTVEKQRNGSWEGRIKLWFDNTSLRFCDDRISAVVPYDMGATRAHFAGSEA